MPKVLEKGTRIERTGKPGWDLYISGGYAHAPAVACRPGFRVGGGTATTYEVIGAFGGPRGGAYRALVRSTRSRRCSTSYPDAVEDRLRRLVYLCRTIMDETKETGVEAGEGATGYPIGPRAFLPRCRVVRCSSAITCRLRLARVCLSGMLSIDPDAGRLERCEDRGACVCSSVVGVGMPGKSAGKCFFLAQTSSVPSAAGPRGGPAAASRR